MEPAGPSTFAAEVTQAPADGATIRGTIRLLVEGSGIENVELLPASSYAPLIARGVVTGDKIGAYIDFDTSVMTDGDVTLRIAVFNAPPGEGGREIIAMPARTWTIANASSQPGEDEDEPLTAALTSAPEDGARLSGIVRLEVSGSGMRNVELLTESGYSPRLGRFDVSGDGRSASLDFDTSMIPNGGARLRISAFDAPAGTSGASEVIAMPPRLWLIRNPSGSEGTPEGRAAACLGARLEHTSLTDPEPVVCIRWTPPSPPVPPEQCTSGLDTRYGNPGDGFPALRNGNVVSKLYCIPASMEGRINPGCECAG